MIPRIIEKNGLFDRVELRKMVYEVIGREVEVIGREVEVFVQKTQ